MFLSLAVQCPLLYLNRSVTLVLDNALTPGYNSRSRRWFFPTMTKLPPVQSQGYRPPRHQRSALHNIFVACFTVHYIHHLESKFAAAWSSENPVKQPRVRKVIFSNVITMSDTIALLHFYVTTKILHYCFSFNASHPLIRNSFGHRARWSFLFANDHHDCHRPFFHHWSYFPLCFPAFSQKKHMEVYGENWVQIEREIRDGWSDDSMLYCRVHPACALTICRITYGYVATLLLFYKSEGQRSNCQCYTSNMPTHRIDWKVLFYTVSGCVVLVVCSVIISFFAIPTGTNDLDIFKQLPTDPGVDGVTILTTI